MSTIVSSASAAGYPGVYAILVSPPRIIRGISLGYLGYVGQFDAGPVGVGYLPQDGDDLVQTYEPKGCARKKPGWYGLMGQLSAPWFIVGVKGAGFGAATLAQAGTGGGYTVTAATPGAWGNGITVQQAPASNGDPTKRNLTFTLVDPVTTQTQEVYRNVAIGQDLSALLAASRLVDTIAWTGSMTVWPGDATHNLGGTVSGTDGAAVAAADYQAALDQLALEGNVRVVVTDDCGDSIRAAVNSDVVAHCTNLYNRVCHITGAKGNDWAAAKTDKANYQSELATYYGAWVQVYGDDGQTLVDVPLSIFGAVIRSNIPVHWSIANHDTQATKYLGKIKGTSPATLYSVASEPIRGEAWVNQIVLPIQGVGPQPGTRGPWQLLHGRTCNLNSGYQYEVTTWYRIYLVTALAPQLDPYVNGPNDLDSGQEIQGVVNAWLEGEVSLRHLTTSLADDGVTTLPPYSTDIYGVNTGSTMANGDFYVSIDGHTPGVRERLLLLVNVGETVSVRRAA
jgi:hypothetical protein